MDATKTGAFIAALRREKGLTQKQLAQQLHVSDKTVSKWECGKGLPEISLLQPLCAFFGVSVNELLSGRRLDEGTYREKAEENMISLLRPRRLKETLMFLSLGAAVFLVPFAVIALAAERILSPVCMPAAAFCSILLLTANLAVGLICGVTKRWGKGFLAAILALHLVCIPILIVLLGIMFVVF